MLSTSTSCTLGQIEIPPLLEGERGYISIWPSVTLLPVDIKVHTVPHFKALINAKVEP